MADDPQEHVRSALLEKLLDLISDDPYPSSTMMNQVEELIRPDELPRYADLLLSKVADERFPSVSMIGRLQALAGG